MAEELKTKQRGFKVWRNPTEPGESIRFLGEFFPPDGQFFMTGTDLGKLGIGPGRYTVLAPPNAPHFNFFSKWRTVVVTE